MKLVDMKLPKKTKKELKEEMKAIGPEPGDQPEYPWGLELEFNDESIKKLPVLQKITANADVKIQAEGYVKRVEITDTADEKRKRHHVRIQVTKIAIANSEAEDAVAEEAFEEGAK